MSNSSPIGIFDSGIGGLTVFRELVRVLPEELEATAARLKPIFARLGCP